MMTHWKRLTCLGNQYQEHGDVTRAREFYLAALAEAERWLALMEKRFGLDADDADAALGAYLCSQHNLADLALAPDDPNDALHHLLAAYNRLRLIFMDATLPPCLRMGAVHYGQRARLLIQQYQGLDDNPAQPSSPHCLAAFAPPVPVSRVLH